MQYPRWTLVVGLLAVLQHAAPRVLDLDSGTLAAPRPSATGAHVEDGAALRNSQQQCKHRRAIARAPFQNLHVTCAPRLHAPQRTRPSTGSFLAGATPLSGRPMTPTV